MAIQNPHTCLSPLAWLEAKLHHREVERDRVCVSSLCEREALLVVFFWSGLDVTLSLIAVRVIPSAVPRQVEIVGCLRRRKGHVLVLSIASGAAVRAQAIRASLLARRCFGGLAFRASSFAMSLYCV